MGLPAFVKSKTLRKQIEGLERIATEYQRVCPVPCQMRISFLELCSGVCHIQLQMDNTTSYSSVRAFMLPMEVDAITKGKSKKGEKGKGKGNSLGAMVKASHQPKVTKAKARVSSPGMTVRQVSPVLTSTKFSRKPGPYKAMFKTFTCNVSRGSQEAGGEDTTLGSVAFEAPLAWELTIRMDPRTHKKLCLRYTGTPFMASPSWYNVSLLFTQRTVKLCRHKARHRRSDRPNNPSLVECNMA